MRFQIKIFVFIFLFSLVSALTVWSEPLPSLSITGAVNNPLKMDVKNLDPLKTIDVQLNEISSKKDYSGAFIYHGVALKSLLSLAGIEKKATDFNKPVDLAVIIKNQAGECVALSWGEIFYKNPENVVIATSADPILPRKGLEHFADPEACQKMIRILNRKIGFPKLIITSDFLTDRCIENVTEVIVHDLRSDVPGEKSPNPYSETFSVSGKVTHPQTFEKLPDHSPVAIPCHIVGEGRGYHGTRVFGGISLKDVLRSSNPDMNLNTVFLISAPDAYRALVSYGELFFNPHGDRILIADRCDGEMLKEGGKFILVFPDDLMADRMVKAVCKIEVIHLEGPSAK
jgi:hypothetical protein